MVIRNKEERTDSIWRFVGVAAIPLLLLFLAGFSLGNTAGKEKTANRKLLEEAEKKIADLEAKLLLRDSFFQRGNVLLSKVGEKVDEFDKELRGIAGQITEDDILLSDWERSVNKYFNQTKIDLDKLEIDFKQNKDLESPMNIGLQYFQDFVEMNRMRLMVQQKMTVGKAKEGKLDDLSKMQEDLDKQAKDFKADSEAQKKDLEIIKLQNKLDKCEKDLDAFKQAGASSANKATVEGIKGTIKKVQVEYLPLINDKGWRNDNKRLTELREKITTSLSNVMIELGSIK